MKNKFIFIWVVATASMLNFSKAEAAWLTINSKVKGVSTYGHTNTVLVTLETAGREVTSCSNKTTFAIASDMEQSRIDKMYSMLLAAKIAQAKIGLAYDDTACVS